MAVYNVAGQLVQTLVDEQKDSGLHSVEWDARGIASGVYFYRLTAGDHSSAKKCVIAR
jgi:flagellar hook assembly protein FlgD